MVDVTKITDDQWVTAAAVLRGAAAQADEYSEVLRKSGAEHDMGFASQAAGLRRLARFCEDDDRFNGDS